MITDLNLDGLINKEYIHENHASIIMFYGASCGPCKATMPFYEEAANFYVERGAKIKFYKIHAWENEETQKYCGEHWSINGVPHFKGLYENVNIERRGGGDLFIMKEFIQQMVDEVFKLHGAKI